MPQRWEFRISACFQHVRHPCLHLLIAALLTEAGMSKCAIAGAASQHNAVERQFRYPIEYGAQKPATAQWTVTAAGVAAVSPYKKGFLLLKCATIGCVTDLGMTDPLNMGAAMAPAAADTLKRHLTAMGQRQVITMYHDGRSWENRI